MALLDPERRCIVIRVVYDGPALAGKTTNLKVLARSLGSEIFSGEEADGRTLFFDWVDYVGGSFDGMPIRCQIVGVPGQQVLMRRRRLLLETADTVVFVADSRPEQLAENKRAFGLLREVMAPMTPKVGIVAQANKRDIENPIALETLRDALDGGPALAITEAVAERGEGVRETFVFAVRLALDRVREQWKDQTLPKVEPKIEDGQQLYAAMKQAEQEEAPIATALGLHDMERRTPLPNSEDQAKTEQKVRNGAPPLPEASVPPGSVWPPVEGRVVIHEASRTKPICDRHRNGDWLAISQDWLFRSPFEGLFFDRDKGRAALVDWARWHAAAGGRLSTPRAVVLVPEAHNAWRLWQIVRRVRALDKTCQAFLTQPDDVLLGEGLFRVIDLRLQAESELVGAGWIAQLDLGSVSATEEGSPVFADFAPFPAQIPSAGTATSFDEERLVRDELGPILRSSLALAPSRIPAVLKSVQSVATRRDRKSVASLIRQVLLSS